MPNKKDQNCSQWSWLNPKFTNQRNKLKKNKNQKKSCKPLNQMMLLQLSLLFKWTWRSNNVLSSRLPQVKIKKNLCSKRKRNKRKNSKRRRKRRKQKKIKLYKIRKTTRKQLRTSSKNLKKSMEVSTALKTPVMTILQWMPTFRKLTL